MEKKLSFIFRLQAPLSKFWRTKRFNLFKDKINPKMTDRLLDVGGYPTTWTVNEPVVGGIDLLNIYDIEWDTKEAPDHHITMLIGDGCSLEIPDKSYDVAFSNSVIEHVESWERQCSFASEIRRVGKAIWVQTPARECPIEPHYLALFVHWLPKELQRKIIKNGTLWGWITRPSKKEIDESVDGIRLISKEEMRQLFPDCEIHTEKLLGIFPKSYVAYRLG